MIIGGAVFVPELSTQNISFNYNDFGNGTYLVTYNTTIAAEVSTTDVTIKEVFSDLIGLFEN